MDEEIFQHKIYSQYYCDRLLSELGSNESDAYSFFGGELYRTYTEVNEQIIYKLKNIQNQIRKL